MLREENLITESERNAIHTINGHGSAMANDVYVRRSMGRDVKNGLNVFKVMAGEIAGMNTAAGTNNADIAMIPQNEDTHLDSPVEEDLLPQDDYMSPMHQNMLSRDLTSDSGNRSWHQSATFMGLAARYKEIEWGSKRADKDKPITAAARFVWLDVEVEFVGSWCLDYKKKYPHSKNSAIGQCRDALYTDTYSDLHGYFHVKHVASKERLSHGFDMYLKKHGLA